LKRLVLKIHHAEDGQMAITMLLTLMAIIAVTALSLDVGAWYFDHRLAQNQADAAALAGILELPGSEADALEAVDDFLEKNGTDAATEGDCPTSDDSNHVRITSSATGGPLNTVTVCVRRQSRSFFAALAGIDFVHVSAMARARVDRIDSPYSLMALSTTACPATDISGQANIEAPGGLTYTGGTCSSGLTVRGQGSLSADGHHVVGGASVQGGNANLDPNTPEQVEPLGDPFGFLTQPDADGCLPGFTGTALVSINITDDFEPGTYCSPVELNTQSHITMAPGVYVFKRGLTVRGELISDGEVLIYGTCPTSPCAGQPAANLHITAQATVDLTGHSDYENILFWLDRTSGAPQTVVGSCPTNRAICISGSGSISLFGSVYAATGSVDIAGTGEATDTAELNISVVSNVLSFRGQGTLVIPYDAALAPPEYISSLVE
jgi:hypothetical protein